MLFDILEKKQADVIEEIKKAFSDVSKNDTSRVEFHLNGIQSDAPDFVVGRPPMIICSFEVSHPSRPYTFLLDLGFQFGQWKSQDQYEDIQINKIQAFFMPLLRKLDNSGEWEIAEHLESHFSITKKSYLTLPECAEKIAEFLASDFENDFTMCKCYFEHGYFSDANASDDFSMEKIDVSSDSFQELVHIWGGLHDATALNSLQYFFVRVKDRHQSIIEMNC